MKILLIDILSPYGHVNYNRGLIRVLNNRGNSITFCSERKMLEDVCLGYNIGTKTIPNSLFFIDASNWLKRAFRPLKWRSRLIGWYFANAKFINQFDYVLFTSAEPFFISFISRFIRVKCGFVDHGIGKIADSFLYRMSYKYLLSNNVDILTLEEYINDFVTGILKRSSYVLYHPIYINNNKSIKPQDLEENIIFAPSGGNDLEFIKELQQKVDFIPSNFKIIIRSSDYTFENDRLIVYNKTLSRETYYNYMSMAAAILIPYENTYNYRTSAIFFEAMANNKPVLILNNNTLAQFAKKFSKVAVLINSSEELEDAFYQTRNIEIHEYQNVLEQYSDIIIQNQFMNLCQRNSPKL